MANSAQLLKTRAANARTTNAAAIKAQHEAAIARLTVLLTAAADAGEERFALPQTHQDFELWKTPAGQAYIIARGFTVNEVNYTNGRVLEIDWSNPSNVP